MNTDHSRRYRNRQARVANGATAVLYLVIFLLSLISFSVFLMKQLHVNNETIYNNSTFGDCLLYASDTEDSTYPSIHLGRSQLCAFVIYGELCVTVFALVFFFFLLFKVVVGCAL